MARWEGPKSLRFTPQRFALAGLFFLIPALLPHAAAGQTCPAPQSPAACQEANAVNQWRCWQKTLRSTGYAGANAYRDLEITVEFRNASTNALVRSGWGFWDCTETTGQETFRIRTALPAGASGTAATYKWDVRCRKRTGAPASVKDCAAQRSVALALAVTVTLRVSGCDLRRRSG